MSETSPGNLLYGLGAFGLADLVVFDLAPSKQSHPVNITIERTMTGGRWVYEA